MKIQPHLTSRFLSTLLVILAIHQMLWVRCVSADLVPVQSGITDSLSHPPPDNGPFAYNTFVPPNVPGASYIDPVFGATVRRLSVDHVPDDSYARNMFWNADGTKYLHRTTNGTPFSDFWDVLDTGTGRVTHKAIRTGDFAADVGFDPVDPNVFYKYVGNTIHKITLLSDGTWSDAVYFTAPDTIKTLGGTINWLDASGRYMVVRYGAEPSVYLYDRQNLGAGPYANPVDGANTIDAGSYVGITPDGKYLAGYHNGGQYNMGYGISWALDHANRSVSTSPVDFWDLCGDHGTFISASDGRDYMVINDCANTPELWSVDITNNVGGQSDILQKAAPNNKLILTASWNTPSGGCGHKSAVAKGPLKDWAFCSAENAEPFNGPVTPWSPFQQEIFAINVMSGEIRRLAHHRSRGMDGHYLRSPRLSASWGGEYVGWNSDFNQTDAIDVFVVPFGVSPGNVLPMPQVNFPNSLPVNGTLTIRNYAAYADTPVSFIWSFVPVAASNRSPRASALASTAGAVPLKTNGQMASLASISLPPGDYQVFVQAIDGQGHLSPSTEGTLTLVNAGFGALRVYPNPWRSDKHAAVPQISFTGLPANATVKLFTSSGHLARELRGNGTIAWDLTNGSGEKVASGIYMYLVTDGQGNKVRGKVGVMK